MRHVENGGKTMKAYEYLTDNEKRIFGFIECIPSEYGDDEINDIIENDTVYSTEYIDELEYIVNIGR